MANETAQDWADTYWRAWRVGHWHKKKEAHYSAGDTLNGVLINVMPSISGVDHWHYQKGWIKSYRIAESWVWGRDTGYYGHFASPLVKARR